MITKKASASPTRFTTGKVRLSYVTVFTPRAIEAGQEEKYSVSIIIDKDDKVTLDAYNKALAAAYAAGADKLGKNGKVPPLSAVKCPLSDGDLKDDEAYHGKWFINANSKNKPDVVDSNLQKILDPMELKSGDYGRVSINLYAFDKKSKGIAAGLGNVQKLEDGEPLGSTVAATTDFGGDNDDDI